MITRGEMAFVESQVRHLVDAEEKLNEASAGYMQAKAKFDRHMDRLGYAEDDPVGLVRREAEKANHPALDMWSGKAEWYQREITARATLISALSDVAWLRGEYEDQNQYQPFSAPAAPHGRDAAPHPAVVRAQAA